MTRRLAEAFTYALDLHAGQVRKQAAGESPRDSVPYVSHLMMVAALVIEHGGTEDEAIAALLHDGPEDCGGRVTLEVIRYEFGERVAEIVETCTDTMKNPKPDWWPRKKSYLDRLRTASSSALLVSLADKTHNAEATLADVTEYGEEFWDRFTQGREGSLWYYGTLVEIYRERVTGRAVRLVDRLERAFVGLCRDEAERAAALSYEPPARNAG